MLPQIMPLPWTMVMIIVLVSFHSMYQTVKIMKKSKSTKGTEMKMNKNSPQW